MFRFEPLIIAVECKDVEAAQFLVSLAISCGFRESGITSVSKRVIVAIRCSIRLEVPLGGTRKMMVTPEYVKFLVEIANDKMETNRKRTDVFFDYLLKNEFARPVNSVEKVMENGRVGSDEYLECEGIGKSESLIQKEKRDVNESQDGSSCVIGVHLSSSQITVSEPAERLFLWGHSACTLGGTNDKKVLIFGGFGGIGRHARRNDTFLLDPKKCTIEVFDVLKAPSSRMGHTATVVGDSMYVIGGRSDPLNCLNDVWMLKNRSKEWHLLQSSGSVFPPSHRHAAAAIDSKIYVFGGIQGDVITSSLYVFDTENSVWSDICIKGEWPASRHSHSMQAFGSQLYMFGGYDGEKALADLYTFSVQTCEWRKLEIVGRGPTPRFSHSMFVYNNYLGVIGGCPISQQNQILSLLDLQSFSWKHIRVNSLGSSLFVRSTGSVIGDELIMIGGGASCYAFGTKFSEPVKIDLAPLMFPDVTFPGKTAEVQSFSQKFGFTALALGSGQGDVQVDQRSDVNAAHPLANSCQVLQLERKYAKLGKDILKRFGWLDRGRKVCVKDDGLWICFPVVEKFCTSFDQRINLDTAEPVCIEGLLLEHISESGALDILMALGATRLAGEILGVRKLPISPLQAMKEAVSSLIEDRGLSLDLLEQLPSRWERLGDIVVLPVSSFKDPAWNTLGDELWTVVAKSLGARRLARQGPIAPTGTRDSKLEIVVGDSGWVEHRENGILYSFDATKCMFSWGNLSEKLRISHLDCTNEVVVDLFAGIGYFTLPFLVRSHAKMVYACEWNPWAVEALRRNLHANSVSDRCVILEGDNRITCPKGVADRVCLGLLPTSEGSWVTAVRALKSDGGTLHVHGNVKDTEEHSWTDYVARSIQNLASSEGYGWEVSVEHVERVKWYAPHVRHLVADVRCCKI